MARGADVQRKIFRVEQMVAGGRPATAPEDIAAAGKPAQGQGARRALTEKRDEAIDATAQTLERELTRLHRALAGNKSELTALLDEWRDGCIRRAAGELNAAVESMEKATQKILQSTECIDDGAKSLGSSLKNDYERGLVQDIQEHAVKIYEACNFQDLAGQRIAKAVAAMNRIERQLSVILERWNAFERPDCATKESPPAAGRFLVNGPKLDGDAGHAEQRDIDALFH
jgi:chemotaxis protein CheZ